MLVKHTLCLETGAVLEREIIDETAEPDTRILVNSYANRVKNDMKKGGHDAEH